MHKKLFPVVIFILSIIFLFPNNLGLADESSALERFQEEWSLERYIKYFYNRYSTHFDKMGFFYMAPQYDVKKWKKPQTAREYMSFASYYKFRAQEGDLKAREIIKNSIREAMIEIDSRPANTQSFEDAEANFLIIEMLKALPEIFSSENKNILLWMSKSIEPGIKAPDTENRAIISGVHWQFIVDYLYAEGIINFIDKERYGKMIQDKIDFAIRTNITKQYWYVEGRFNDFTPHYHAVSAYMLLLYAKLTGKDKYGYIADKMYRNIKRISFNNGMVEASLGHRPIGLGAQFYLMAGILGKGLEDKEFATYLFYGSGERFFSDPSYPDRLEYHSTLEGTLPQYHDDYSFVDIGELALSLPSLRAGSFRYTYYVSIPEIIPEKGFIEKNTGREIIFNNRHILSGTYGNWSQVVK